MEDGGDARVLGSCGRAVGRGSEVLTVHTTNLKRRF
jgi:hypothetical protein